MVTIHRAIVAQSYKHKRLDIKTQSPPKSGGAVCRPLLDFDILERPTNIIVCFEVSFVNNKKYYLWITQNKHITATLSQKEEYT